MNIIEKTLGVKEGQRFTYFGFLNNFIYIKGNIANEHSFDNVSNVSGETLLLFLNNPDMVKIIQEKKKLPRFVFDWIEYWEEEIGGVDDRELMGINVSQELVRIDILIHKIKTIKSVVLQVHLSNIKATKKMISLEEFYNTFEAEEV